MTHSGSGGPDDPRKPHDDDATRIVGQQDNHDDSTRIVSRQNSVISGPPQGTLIGVSQIQQGVRVAGQSPAGTGMPPPPPASPGAPAPSGDETIFVPAGGAPDAVGGEAYDPVVGWLVVTDGKGKGQHRSIFYGQNSVGRDGSQRISLDFGDPRISREEHAFIIYDDQQRRFYIRDNGKSNLVRVSGTLVMQPTELRDRDLITIGETTLLFVALCDENFDWLAMDSSSNAASSP